MTHISRVNLTTFARIKFSGVVAVNVSNYSEAQILQSVRTITDRYENGVIKKLWPREEPQLSAWEKFLREMEERVPVFSPQIRKLKKKLKKLLGQEQSYILLLGEEEKRRLEQLKLQQHLYQFSTETIAKGKILFLITPTIGGDDVDTGAIAASSARRQFPNGMVAQNLAHNNLPSNTDEALLQELQNHKGRWFYRLCKNAIGVSGEFKTFETLGKALPQREEEEVVEQPA